MRPSELVEQFGGTYAKELGIDLSGGDPREIHKWFVAAVLFGARISSALAAKTYRELEQAGMLSPRRMLEAGWDAVVAILDRGGYARYDFKTATKLLDVHRVLLQEYKGDLNLLHDDATDAADLVQRLKNLGKGIGDVTVEIFLRELRGRWSKASPLPSARAIAAAKTLKLIPARMRDPATILEELREVWRKDGIAARDFADFEAALVRYGTQLQKKTRVRKRNKAPDDRVIRH